MGTVMAMVAIILVHIAGKGADDPKCGLLGVADGCHTGQYHCLTGGSNCPPDAG